MSKYTYTQVENLSDLDITGDTQYYLFEEVVGHKEFEKEKMKRCSLYGLESYIEDRTIFTREEKPWYERIPEKGVLCWDNYHDYYRVIVKYRKDTEDLVDTTGFTSCVEDLTPLTNQEIKEFLQEEE